MGGRLGPFSESSVMPSERSVLVDESIFLDRVLGTDLG